MDIVSLIITPFSISLLLSTSDLHCRLTYPSRTRLTKSSSLSVPASSSSSTSTRRSPSPIIVLAWKKVVNTRLHCQVMRRGLVGSIGSNWMAPTSLQRWSGMGGRTTCRYGFLIYSPEIIRRWLTTMFNRSIFLLGHA